MMKIFLFIFSVTFSFQSFSASEEKPVSAASIGEDSAFTFWVKKNNRPFRSPRSLSSLSGSSSEEERDYKVPTRLRGRSLSPQGSKFLKSLSLYLSTENCSVDFSYASAEILGQDKESNVVYLTEKERETFRAYPILYLGKKACMKLFWGNSSLVDTTKWSSKVGKGYGAYALSIDGALYIAEHRSQANLRSVNFAEESLCGFQKSNKQEFYHSSFFGGRPGICFGMIRVENGLITYLDRNSGHYKPSEENLERACEILSPFFSRERCELVSEVSWEHCAALLFQGDSIW